MFKTARENSAKQYVPQLSEPTGECRRGQDNVGELGLTICFGGSQQCCSESCAEGLTEIDTGVCVSVMYTELVMLVPPEAACE